MNKADVARLSIAVFPMSFASCAWTAAPNEGQMDLQIDFSISEAEVGSCDPITLSASVRNRSEIFEVSLPAVMADPYYWLRIELIGPDGQRRWYEGPEFQLVGLEEKVVLFPGFFFGSVFELTCDAYDFSAAGKYEISLVYGRGPTARKSLESTFRSNAQTFVVQPE